VVVELDAVQKHRRARDLDRRELNERVALLDVLVDFHHEAAWRRQRWRHRLGDHRVEEIDHVRL
jgi:hypothetical protein